MVAAAHDEFFVTDDVAFVAPLRQRVEIVAPVLARGPTAGDPLLPMIGRLVFSPLAAQSVRRVTVEPTIFTAGGIVTGFAGHSQYNPSTFGRLALGG